jgi:hypothetical protein
VVREVKGVDELGVRVACRGARSRGDRRSKVEVGTKRRSHRHDISDLALETVEESRSSGEDQVLIGLRELTCQQKNTWIIKTCAHFILTLLKIVVIHLDCDINIA